MVDGHLAQASATAVVWRKCNNMTSLFCYDAFAFSVNLSVLSLALWVIVTAMGCDVGSGRGCGSLARIWGPLYILAKLHAQLYSVVFFTTSVLLSVTGHGPSEPAFAALFLPLPDLRPQASVATGGCQV